MSVGDAFYRIVDNIGRRDECKSCVAYKEFLEVETQRSRYFENLLLTRAGIIQADTQVEVAVEHLPIHRVTTLSQLRRAAELMSKAKPGKSLESALAEEHEKTEAEILFEKELANKGTH